MLKIEINKFISIIQPLGVGLWEDRKKHELKFSYRALFISYQVRF